MMNFTSNHCGVSISLYFKACYPVSVYVAAFKVTLENTEIKPEGKATTVSTAGLPGKSQYWLCDCNKGTIHTQDASTTGTECEVHMNSLIHLCHFSVNLNYLNILNLLKFYF